MLEVADLQSLVLKSLGMKWAIYKGKLKAEYFEGLDTVDEQLDNKHDRVPRDQWTMLVTHWNSRKGKEVFKKKLSELPNTSQFQEGVAMEDDIYSQVFGPERSGLVRGIGLGATPTSLWDSSSSIGTSRNIQVSQHDDEVNKLKEEVKALKSNQARMEAELGQLKLFMG
ncbi:hypothetical protein Cni_G14135 [Canna indica]|uniref:Transposase, Ptta/En/Spm, plant n=1 Tax=Canna indica TaxID=4628 RepID=A0AAQ3KBB1_9LILI|nr:hypothetical protein Cni_G14135 [Canna indica]